MKNNKMSAPVKNTCPDIDRLIKLLRDIQHTAKEGMRESEKHSDVYQRFKDCEWDIDDIIYSLEDLRKANAALRDWGESLDSEVESLSNYVNDLESKIESLSPVENNSQ